MTKTIFPVQGKYLHVKTISTCVMLRNYVETHYETEELRCYSFCGRDIRKWSFHSINNVLTFYAYCLNHLGIDGFKLRLKKKVIGDPSRTAHPRFKKHLSSFKATRVGHTSSPLS